MDRAFRCETLGPRVRHASAGHHASGVGAVAFLASSIPIDNTQWQAIFRNPSATTASMWAYAVCATVAP